MSAQPTTELLQHWLDRMQTGDTQARHQLVHCAFDRLQRLARKMLRTFPGVKRWEQTDDVLQNALVRLDRALQEVRPPTVQDYFRLAALQMRRELLDLARHYNGPQGLGTRYESQAGETRPGDAESRAPDPTPATASLDPSQLAVWTEFHRQVEALPDEEKQIFDLLWYQGLTQPEASALLNIPERTLKRHWQKIRLKLNQVL